MFATCPVLVGTGTLGAAANVFAPLIVSVPSKCTTALSFAFVASSESTYCIETGCPAVPDPSVIRTAARFGGDVVGTTQSSLLTLPWSQLVHYGVIHARRDSPPHSAPAPRSAPRSFPALRSSCPQRSLFRSQLRTRPRDDQIPLRCHYPIRKPPDWAAARIKYGFLHQSRSALIIETQPETSNDNRENFPNNNCESPPRPSRERRP